MSEPVINGQPVPGVYEGLSMPSYEAIPALRWSRLSEYLRSAAHGKAAESRIDDTDDLTIGQAIHSAVLEPAEFDSRFGTIPDDAPTRRSNDGKAWWARFEAENVGRFMLKPETLALVKRCAEAVYAHPRANLWLTSPKSKREVSLVWMDRSGMYGKARLDLVSNVEGMTRIIDLKSARSAAPYDFSRDIFNFSYHGQLAWYLRGLDAIAPFDRSAAFIAVEKDPAVAVCYDLAPEALEAGNDAVELALKTFVDAEAAQRWPGYADGLISLPPWAMRGRE